MNTKVRIVLILLIAAVMAAGCKKEEPCPVLKQPKSLLESITDEISVTEGILTFSSEEAYENFISGFVSETDGVAEEVLEASMDYVEGLNYTSLYAYKHTQNATMQAEIDSVYGSEVIQHLLNSDYLLIIGDYIYRVNMYTSQVYAMELSNIANINLLINEDDASAPIQVYSTEDDVLEEVHNAADYAMPPAKMQKARCNEDGCGGTGLSGKDTSAVSGGYHVTTTIKYLKFGLYFEVSARVQAYYGYPLSPVPVNPNLYVSLSLQRKCKTLINYGYKTYCGTANNGNTKKILYSCTIPLSKINFSASGRGYFPIGNITTPIVTFRKNL